MRAVFLTTDDAEKIADFQERSGYKDGYSEKVLSSSLNNDNNFFLALVEDGIVTLIEFSLAGDTADIEEVLVLPKMRRKGYAFSVLGTAEEFIKSKGAKKIFLEVRKSNLPAIGLYEKAGYRKISERKKYYPNGEDALVFIKEI